VAYVFGLKHISASDRFSVFVLKVHEIFFSLGTLSQLYKEMPTPGIIFFSTNRTVFLLNSFSSDLSYFCHKKKKNNENY